jgi:hypothetical protein
MRGGFVCGRTPLEPTCVTQDSRPKNHRRDWLAATRWEKYNFCFVVNNRDMRDPRLTDGTGLRRHGGKNIISASWLTTETCVTQDSQTGLACGDTVGKI